MNYKDAGIDDVDAFYQDKFVAKIDYDFSDKFFNFFDIRNAKMVWIYSKIRKGTKVLDFGCGTGSLSVLKRKKCQIVGVDYSKEAVEFAKNKNGYDEVFAGDIMDFDYEGEKFDYIVSLDVFGHIPFEDKDKVIEKLKSLLKPSGVMLHGIECADIDYKSMSKEELQKFVAVDGHVGMEGKKANYERFGRYFKNVSGEVRFCLVNAVEEYVKHHEHYGSDVLHSKFYTYFKCMSLDEQTAFNFANGMVLYKMQASSVPSPVGAEGFLLLEASNVDMSFMDLLFEENVNESSKDMLLRNEIFIRGWYGPEMGKYGFIRWSNGKSLMDLSGMKGKILTLNFKGMFSKVFNVYLSEKKSGRVLKKICMVSILSRTISIKIDSEDFILEIFSDFVHRPVFLYKNSIDDRVLGVRLLSSKIV